jgi:hypothetical protein
MWVNTIQRSTEDIFKEITSKIKVWYDNPKSSTTPYEMLVDYIKDNYDVTLLQCHELCDRLRVHYGIKKFYAVN